MDITPEEYNSVKFYQDSGFYYINTYLRKNECDPDKLESIQAHIKNLDNLFAKSSKTDKILTVYRGESNVYEGINLGFISTSKNLHIAKKFAGSVGAVCELNIQPNIPFIDINTWNNSEAEIILPRGLTFTVKSKKITKKSKHYVIDVSLTANVCEPCFWCNRGVCRASDGGPCSDCERWVSRRMTNL